MVSGWRWRRLVGPSGEEWSDGFKGGVCVVRWLTSKPEILMEFESSAEPRGGKLVLSAVEKLGGGGRRCVLCAVSSSKLE